MLRADDVESFLTRKLAEANADIWNRLDVARVQLKMRACYCSVFDECWVSDLSTVSPQSVGNCPVTPNSFTYLDTPTASTPCAVLLPRQRDRGFDSVGKLRELQLRGIAVQHAQALAAVAQPDAFLPLGPQNGTAVADRDVQPLAVATRLDLDPHRIAAALDAVFKGIFQQRLQQEGRDTAAERSTVDVPL